MSTPAPATRTYLDAASTARMRPVARLAMQEWWEHTAGDPGRMHHEGMTARHALESARERVAAAVGARPREVVFTSGATEAIATACFGAAARGPHAVAAAVEHSAVRSWVTRGRHTVVGVDRQGRINADEVLAAVEPDTGVVHCQWANHEVGTRQPVRAIADRLAALDTVRPLLHVDAAAAVGRDSVRFDDSGADLMSVSGHKFGGPTGTGVLVIRRGLRLDPLLTGGDQERARRAGLEHVAGAVALAAALDEAVANATDERQRMRALTDRVIAWANATANVDVLGDPDDRVPHLVCLAIAGVEPQPVLMGLDSLGVAVHSGNSCSSEALEPSPVLDAMGVDAQRSLRVSVDWASTEADVDRLLSVLPPLIERLTALR